MGRNKKPIRNRPPVMGQREKELLAKLDEIKLTDKKISVVGFAREVGYTNKSALRHFPVLRHELSKYIAKFSMPRPTPGAFLSTKYFESQIERQALVIERLNRRARTIPELKATIARLEQESKRDSEQKKLLRGMLSTVMALLTDSDFAKARDLSRRLEEQVTLLIEDVDDS